MKKKVIVNDVMQRGCVYWRTEPAGTHFAPDFTPDLSPRQMLAVWRRNGWLRPQDPRGWFQWYCRYYMGRRGADDERQIRRWRAISRHVAGVRKNCEPGDLECRHRQRQALLHWAYDSRCL